MTQSTYPPAAQVAGIVEDHFRRHSPGSAHAPGARAVEQIVDAAFWTSLRREEAALREYPSPIFRRWGRGSISSVVSRSTPQR